MAVVGSRLTTTNAAQLVAVAVNRNSGDPVPVVVTNTDTTNAVSLGGSGVTAGNGYPLKAGQSASFDLYGSDSLYAIADAGGPVLGILIGRQ